MKKEPIWEEKKKISKEEDEKKKGSIEPKNSESPKEKVIEVEKSSEAAKEKSGEAKSPIVEKPKEETKSPTEKAKSPSEKPKSLGDLKPWELTGKYDEILKKLSEYTEKLDLEQKQSFAEPKDLISEIGAFPRFFELGDFEAFLCYSYDTKHD